MKRICAVLLVVCLLLVGCGTAELPVTTTTVTTATESTTIVTEATTTATSVAETTAATTTAKTTAITKTTQKSLWTKATTTAATTTTTTTTTKRVTTTTKAPQSTLRVLSIGNSFSQDAHHYISKLAENEGRSIRTVNLYYAGCKLKKHYESWVLNEAIYQYEVNGAAGDANMLVKLSDILVSEPWDVITLQEASYSSCSSTAMQPYLNNLIAVIRQNAPQAKIYLHQTWAYADGYKSHNSTTGGSMAAMWNKVKTNYDIASAETGLPLIPSGEAIFNAQQEFNKRGKGESIQRDGSHVDKSWGRYLLALVWYKTLTGETPSNTFENFDGFYLPDDTVRKMIHKVAMDAVAAYT